MSESKHIDRIADVRERTGNADTDARNLLRVVAKAGSVVAPAEALKRRPGVCINEAGKGHNNAVALPSDIVAYGDDPRDAAQAALGLVITGGSLALITSKDNALLSNGSKSAAKFDHTSDFVPADTPIDDETEKSIADALYTTSTARVIYNAERTATREAPGIQPYIDEHKQYRVGSKGELTNVVSVDPEFASSPEGIKGALKAIADAASKAVLFGKDAEYGEDTPAIVRDATDEIIKAMGNIDARTRTAYQDAIAAIRPKLIQFITDAENQPPPEPKGGGGKGEGKGEDKQEGEGSGQGEPPAPDPSPSVDQMLNAIMDSSTERAPGEANAEEDKTELKTTCTSDPPIAKGNEPDYSTYRFKRQPEWQGVSITPYARNEYNTITTSTAAATAAIKRAADQLLPTNQRKPVERQNGGNLTQKRLTTIVTRPDDERVFSAKKQPKPVKVAVTVLVDCSGSMNGMYHDKDAGQHLHRIDGAKRMSIAIANAIAKHPNFDLSVIGHSYEDGETLAFYPVLTPKQPDLAGIATLASRSSNADALAIQRTHDYVNTTYPRAKYDYRLIILLFDGRPIAYFPSGGYGLGEGLGGGAGINSNIDDHTYRNMRETVKRMGREGIEFFAFGGFGTFSQSDADIMFPGRCFAISGAIEVAEKLLHVIRKIVHTHK